MCSCNIYAESLYYVLSVCQCAYRQDCVPLCVLMEEKTLWNVYLRQITQCYQQLGVQLSVKVTRSLLNSTMQCVCEHDASIACKDGQVRCLSRTSGLDAVYDVILNWIRFGLVVPLIHLHTLRFPAVVRITVATRRSAVFMIVCLWTHPDV